MELWTRAGRLEGASCSRRLSNKPMLYLNICCFLCRRHEVLPGNPKKVTMTTFASGVICGKSILINPLIRERVAWATDGTKLLVKSICETAPKPLFISICQRADRYTTVYLHLSTRHNWPFKEVRR